MQHILIKINKLYKENPALVEKLLTDYSTDIEIELKGGESRLAKCRRLMDDMEDQIAELVQFDSMGNEL